MARRHTAQAGINSSTTYQSGVKPLRAALSAAGIGIVWMPSHGAARDFPDHVDGLAQYDEMPK